MSDLQDGLDLPTQFKAGDMYIRTQLPMQGKQTHAHEPLQEAIHHNRGILVELHLAVLHAEHAWSHQADTALAPCREMHP